MERAGAKCEEAVLCWFGQAEEAALVLPHLDYCLVVWQECTKDLRRKLKRVQNYGMRIMLSQPPKTPSGELRQKLGWLTLERRREMGRMALVRRCVRKKAPQRLNERLRRWGIA